ncbi:hypothetical protein [Paenibacillus sp. NPDC058174]|uniref:hypothetical protein n=1 Tax=Paenibacillus sp. NPDC058174 TaxID=3346366 RepID=UPI0036DBE3BA
MANPQISWMNETNTDSIKNWDIGTVDAGSQSSSKTFLIWNNRGGSTAVKNAETCTITTKDIAGGDTGDLVTEKWIKVRVDTMSEIGFTGVGGTATRAVKAGGSAPAGVISGAINDGVMENSPSNFAKVTAYAIPSVTATAGKLDFLLRLSYTFQ